MQETKKLLVLVVDHPRRNLHVVVRRGFGPNWLQNVRIIGTNCRTRAQLLLRARDMMPIGIIVGTLQEDSDHPPREDCLEFLAALGQPKHNGVKLILVGPDAHSLLLMRKATGRRLVSAELSANTDELKREVHDLIRVHMTPADQSNGHGLRGARKSIGKDTRRRLRSLLRSPG